MDDGTSGDGLCSLRKAIITSNAAGSINNDSGQGTGFDAIHFNFSGTPITLGSALPAITQNLIIDGTTNTIAIDGAKSFQVLAVNSGATLALNDLTIQNGANPGSQGGGISNGGTLTLTNSTISGNTAEFGGGINNDGTMTLTNSTISGNSAENGTPFDADGGGIINDGTLTVTNSTISGNFADYGAGILNDEGGTATVTDSAITGNSASGEEDVGGGIYNAHSMTVTNSTIAGNSASAGDEGGGIDNFQFGTLMVTNSTITSNSASGGGGGIVNSGDATFKNTIVANNTGGNCVPSAAAGAAFTSDGHNLADDKTCAFAGTGDQNSTAAGLDPGGLKNNGGPTETVALLPTSPAVDAVPMSPTNYCTEIDGTTPITTDQRGEPRPDPEDGPDGPCDIGAFELQVPTATPVAGKLKVSPTTLKFGTVTVDTPKVEMVTVTNAGKIKKKNQPLPILIEMENVDGMPTPSPFSVTTQCYDDNLMPSGKGVPKTETLCKISVQFKPTEAVSYSGTLTIHDNLEPSEMQTVQMTGKGKAAK
jgi:hypothetical protein